MPSNELQENGRLQVFVIAEICAKSHVCIRARTVFTDKNLLYYLIILMSIINIARLSVMNKC